MSESPEDLIPIPGYPVLSEEQTIQQLRADMVRQYTIRITQLESELAAANAELADLRRDMERLNFLASLLPWQIEKILMGPGSFRENIDAAMKGNQ